MRMPKAKGLAYLILKVATVGEMDGGFIDIEHKSRGVHVHLTDLVQVQPSSLNM